MTDYSELKRLAEDVNQNFPEKEDLWNMVCTPTVALDLIAEYERLAANVKLNLCDYPAIHRGDVDLLISYVSGTSQNELAELHGCTPPNISRKIRRVKKRLGWRGGMGTQEIRARAEQLRSLAAQGAVVTVDLMVEREQLKAENDALVSAMNEILRVTPMGVEAFGIAALVLSELGASKEADHD